MLYHKARDLAPAFRIKTSRWKRWARQFLPPDPLGGFQSGYGRQYAFKDVFTLILAGHLVADLRFSVPAVRKILADIGPWLQQTGFLALSPNHDLAGQASAEYTLHIISRMEAVGQPERLDFDYRIKAGDSADDISGDLFSSSKAAPRTGAGRMLKATRKVYLSALYRYCAVEFEKLC